MRLFLEGELSKMRTYLADGGAGFRAINVYVLTYAGNLENLKDIADKRRLPEVLRRDV